MPNFSVRDLSGKCILYVECGPDTIALALDGQCTLRAMRMWIALTFMLVSYPKDRKHAQALAAVEAAMRSPNLTYVSRYQGELPDWVQLLKGMAANHG